jgi:hypothetical protein
VQDFHEQDDISQTIGPETEGILFTKLSTKDQELSSGGEGPDCENDALSQAAT